MLPLMLHLGSIITADAKAEITTTKTIINADVTITGKVTDENGEPIPGVTVSVPGTGIGTATDIDGNYSISVPEQSTLVFSFIGFNSKSIEIGGKSILNVELEESISSLNEVVVVGYGTQKK